MFSFRLFLNWTCGLVELWRSTQLSVSGICKSSMRILNCNAHAYEGSWAQYALHCVPETGLTNTFERSFSAKPSHFRRAWHADEPDRDGRGSQRHQPPVEPAAQRRRLASPTLRHRALRRRAQLLDDGRNRRLWNHQLHRSVSVSLEILLIELDPFPPWFIGKFKHNV